MVISRGVAGGAPIHVLLLLRGLHDRAQTELIVGEPGYLADRVQALRIPVRIVPELVSALAPARDIVALRRIRSHIQAFRPDLVHAHSSKAGVLARYAAHRLGIPAVFTAHGWAFDPAVPNPYRTIARVAERTAARWTARFIAVSDAARRLAITEGITTERRIVTIHNGIPDLEPGTAASAGGPDARDRLVVVMVGRFEAQKDHGTVVRAIRRLAPRWEAWLIGDGPTRPAIEAEAARLGVGDHVRFLGVRTDVPELLAGADALALASRWEGFPLTVLEAMRATLPVVATDVGGVAEAVADGRTGFLVPAGDDVALADRLARLAADPALRTALGREGRRRFEASFTLEHMMRRTLAVYEDVLGPSARGVGDGA